MGTDADKLIGLVGIYHGVEHPYLSGYPVCVVAVVKRPGGDPDKGTVCATNAELVAAGGLDPEHDIVEVVPWLTDRQRWSFVCSDVRLADLRYIRETR
jgi:hypothetical protein